MNILLPLSLISAAVQKLSVARAATLAEDQDGGRDYRSKQSKKDQDHKTSLPQMQKGCRAKNLRESSYKEVGIVPDLTVQQRREEQQLSEEADRRNREELTTEDQTKNLKWLVVGPRGAKKIIKGVPRNAQPATRGTGWRGRGRGGRARGGTGANSLPLGRQPARIETTLLLPPTQLLPSTAQRERLESNSNKRKDRSEGTEEDEEEMEESTSPARKK